MIFWYIERIPGEIWMSALINGKYGSRQIFFDITVIRRNLPSCPAVLFYVFDY